MVDKITNPPSQKDLIDKVNELVDDKQDTLVSGTNIKTINNTSILGSGNIDIQSGSSYTAGTGIDITNDVISVDNSIVTTNTAQDITARKTFFGEKAIYFKQSIASNKLGFTLYNNNNKEVGALEFRPNTIGSTPLLTLNSSSPNSASYVGFRYWSYSLNIIAPFSTSLANKNFFIPVTFTNGTTTVESTSTDGSVNISSLLPTKTSDLTNDSGYITASSLPTVNNATLTITQGGVSKGTFTANASSDVTIALDAGGGSSYTAGTGIDITNDVISVEGVKDQRNTSTAIKTWTGTKAQYDAIVTKDNNTLYNITDDTDVSLTILEALYPVGSVYITTASTCPLSTLISGSSWTLVSSGRVLQGADNDHSAGTTIEAGLPNITGNITPQNLYNEEVPSDGVFTTYAGSASQWTGSAQLSRTIPIINFDASRSNQIYGNSNTVQPPAYVVNIFRRTL